MSAKQPSELLYDSEATLRLVDTAIRDMGDLDGDHPTSPEPRMRAVMVEPDEGPLGLAGLSDLVARGYTEILGVLDSLRQSRHLLERAAVEKIQHTHDRLREVSNATESAATDILNGLDRANMLVDDLEAYASRHGEPDDSAHAIRTSLRDELFALVGHMQFQDITSQQLTYASAVLSEMEARLSHIARVFDPAAFGGATPARTIVPPAGAVTYDPNASTHDRAERQAVADAIVATRAGD